MTVISDADRARLCGHLYPDDRRCSQDRTGHVHETSPCERGADDMHHDWVPRQAMTRPSTEAGREYIEWAAGMYSVGEAQMVIPNVLAIEQEARDTALAALLTTFRGMAFGEPRCVPLTFIEAALSEAKP